jgi:hypothetical protein
MDDFEKLNEILQKEEMKRRVIRRFIEKPEIIDRLIESLQSDPEEWIDEDNQNVDGF